MGLVRARPKMRWQGCGRHRSRQPANSGSFCRVWGDRQSNRVCAVHLTFDVLCQRWQLDRLPRLLEYVLRRTSVRAEVLDELGTLSDANTGAVSTHVKVRAYLEQAR